MKKVAKKVRPRPIVVKWADAVRHEEGWEDIPLGKPEDTEYCLSYGLLIAEDEKAITVGPHVGWTDDGADQANGSVTIPKSAIISVRRLNLGRELWGNIERPLTPSLPSSDQTSISEEKVRLSRMIRPR